MLNDFNARLYRESLKLSVDHFVHISTNTKDGITSILDFWKTLYYKNDQITKIESKQKVWHSNAIYVRFSNQVVINW